MAGETTNPDFDALGVGIPTWDETAFRESPSQGSESSSSSSSWELASRELASMEMAMGADIDMGLQFPSVDVDTIGDGSGLPTGEEFLRAILEVAQSTPKVVRPLFCAIVLFVRVLIDLPSLALLAGTVNRARWIRTVLRGGHLRRVNRGFGGTFDRLLFLAAD